LTIKLTQHVAFAARCPAIRLSRTTPRVWQVRLSTLRYSRAKFAVLSRCTNLDIRATQCQLPSVVKDRSFRSSISDRNVSAPGGARFRFGAEPAENKKPGNECRANPSFFLGLFPLALERMYSKLVFVLPGIRNQSHLMMSRQTRTVRRHERTSEVCRLPWSISEFQMTSSVST